MSDGIPEELDSSSVELSKSNLTDAAIRLVLIALLGVLCLRIFAPFANLVIWAFILAIALYPLQLRLAQRLGGRQGWAATLLVLGGLLLIGLPTVMLGASFAERVHDSYRAFENNAIVIPQPKPEVADWPVVGKRIYGAWRSAAADLPEFMANYQEQLRDLAGRALSAAAATAGSVLLFLGSLVIAGIMMTYGESGSETLLKVLARVVGPDKGSRLQSLATATVRSVATGVIGVALIQALLLGVGFMMADIPAAGVLALGVMLLGIVQLPALIVSLPVVAFLWISGDGSTTSNLVYTLYLLVAGMADNVLKPLLLGRGVDAPMPIILMGALGGMIMSGIIGLFLGAVVLAVGYKVFMQWVDPGEELSGV